MNDFLRVMMAMNNSLVTGFANYERIDQMQKVRQNCIAADGSHEEQDMNSHILICHRDNRPCMVQCMNGATNIRDGIYG